MPAALRGTRPTTKTSNIGPKVGLMVSIVRYNDGVDIDAEQKHMAVPENA